jgi:hypothetical protein
MTMKYPKRESKMVSDGLLKELALPVCTGGGIPVYVRDGADCVVVVDTKVTPPVVVEPPMPNPVLVVSLEETNVGSTEPEPLEVAVLVAIVVVVELSTISVLDVLLSSVVVVPASVVVAPASVVELVSGAGEVVVGEVVVGEEGCSLDVGASVVIGCGLAVTVVPPPGAVTVTVPCEAPPAAEVVD